MARKADNGGCGLIVLCLLVIVAIGKCTEGPTPVAKQSSAADLASVPSIEGMPMYVSAATLNCRAEPEPRANVLEKLSRGDAVTAGETQGHWVKLDRPGEDCWTVQRFLSESQPEPDPLPQSAPLYSPPADTLTSLSSSTAEGGSCGAKWKCGQMDSCAEAYHYLNECGVGRLDGDGDGVPCESIC